MDVGELSVWAAYDQREPIGRTDWNIALQTAALVKLWSGKKGTRKLKPEKFMMFMGERWPSQAEIRREFESAVAEINASFEGEQIVERDEDGVDWKPNRSRRRKRGPAQ